MSDVLLRPLTHGDVWAAQELGYETLREAGTRYGWTTPPLDDAGRTRGQRRLRHCLRHDPEGAWVAELEGTLVGVALATRRERLWFLSLLTVARTLQGAGVGRRLLEAAMGTFHGVGAICASDDPKALRRYALAGFAIRPALYGKGTVDRSLLPATPDVRDGSLERDRDLVEAVAGTLRGAPHGPDLDHLVASGGRLLVTDSPRGRGYAFGSPTGCDLLGASTPEAAATLLWAVLAEIPGEAELEYLTSEQQWAVQVALAARLPLRPGGSHCVRGVSAPLAPYLPSGAFG